MEEDATLVVRAADAVYAWTRLWWWGDRTPLVDPLAWGQAKLEEGCARLLTGGVDIVIPGQGEPFRLRYGPTARSRSPRGSGRVAREPGVIPWIATPVRGAQSSLTQRLLEGNSAHQSCVARNERRLNRRSRLDEQEAWRDTPGPPRIGAPRAGYAVDPGGQSLLDIDRRDDEPPHSCTDMPPMPTVLRPAQTTAQARPTNAAAPTSRSGRAARPFPTA